MLPKYIDPDNRLVEIGIRALYNVIIQVFFIPEHIHPFKNKIKQRLQVLRARTSNEYIRIPMRERCCNGHTQRSGLASTARRSKRDRRRKCLLGNSFNKCQKRLGLSNSWAGDRTVRSSRPIRT